MAELKRLEDLEERPAGEPSTPTIDTAGAWTRSACRASASYAAGAAAARAAVLDDEATRAAAQYLWSADDAGELPFGNNFDILPTAIWATRASSTKGTDPRLVPPISVRAARLRPDYRSPNGWFSAIAKEVHRVEKFGAIRLVRFRAYRDAARLNPLTTSIGYLVPVLTCKADPNGDPRELDVLNKFRISLSEGKRDGLADVETHSLCVDEITNRLITLIAPAIGATQTSIDVGGAYFHGTPPTLEQGGRTVFAVVPPWLAEFGPYPERNPEGSRNLLLVTGNMPGRCDAGRIWQQQFDAFHHQYGLRQLVTDRRA